MNNSIVLGNSGSTSNVSQVGVNHASLTGNGKITNGGITNSIFGIIASGTWATTTINNKLDAVIADLAFAGSLSTDAVPVLKIGSSSIAKNYVTANAISLLTDQLGNTRDANPDAGAYEFVDLGTSVSTPKEPEMMAVRGRTIYFNATPAKVEIFNLSGSLVKVLVRPETVLMPDNAGAYIVKTHTLQGVRNQKIIIN
jgi:hypothetical protein